MEIEAQLQNTYKLVKQTTPQIEVDSLEVVKKVEEHRQFWKPNEAKVVLLAESHVYTDQEDFEIETTRSFLQWFPNDYPSKFVRFVYCLGYGENEILTKKPKRTNTGTPQYWEIFSSCVAENKDDLGFNKILKTGTRYLRSRIRNKLNLLEQMKNRGVWLLDASIVGLYGNNAKNYPDSCRSILEICWDNYIREVIEDASPKFIIVIGKQVGNTLCSRLNKLEIDFEILYQPQARISAEERMRNFQRFNKICKLILKSEKIPPSNLTHISPVEPRPPQPEPKPISTIERNLQNLGYIKNRRTEWQKKDRVVHIVNSTEFGSKIRIGWREEWRGDHAMILNYSEVNGPVCIVPIQEFFNSNFVIEKSQKQSYANSGYRWAQTFSLDHPLVQFVLSYKDRWDIL